MAQARREAADDAVLTRIGQAIMLHRGGDREEARNRLVRLWEEIGPTGDPLHRCTLAHYLADAQDDPADALHWDLLALAAADVPSTKGPPPPDGPGPLPSHQLRVFYPLLHLNLAADYLRLGRPAAARTQWALARKAARVLGDDPYGAGVQDALARLALRLADASGTGDDRPSGGAFGPAGDGGAVPPQK